VLILVRHGRTAANAARLLLGRADPALDEVGRAQALAVATALGPVARVVTSPLIRARETASAFGSTAGVDVDARWVELDYGALDGVALGAVPGEVWAAFRNDPGFVPEGGESLAALGARVRAACDELVPAATDGDVVVVSHVSPIKAAVAWALGAGDEVAWRMWVAPGSITRIAIGPDGPVLRSFNETAHLD
jgi:broad specificity phosphatase PhoE